MTDDSDSKRGRLSRVDGFSPGVVSPADEKARQDKEWDEIWAAFDSNGQPLPSVSASDASAAALAPEKTPSTPPSIKTASDGQAAPADGLGLYREPPINEQPLAVGTDAAYRGEDRLPEGGGPTKASESAPEEERYSFPYRQPEFDEALRQSDAVSTEVLLGQLADIRQDMSRYSGHPVCAYGEIRTRLCAIHLALNQRKAIAPAFRPWPSVGGPKAGRGSIDSDVEPTGLEALMRDRQVIDLDWIQRHESANPANEAVTLFAGPELDFDRAAHFAASKLTAKKKLSLLGIAPALEGVMHSRGVEWRWAASGWQTR